MTTETATKRAVYEPCAACASRGFGLPCPTHGPDFQGALNPYNRPVASVRPAGPALRAAVESFVAYIENAPKSRPMRMIGVQGREVGRLRAALDAPERRPLVLVDITGGLETASYLYPGVGEPELRIFDLDDETDEQDRLADELDELARLIRERSDHPDDLYAATRYEAEAAHVRHRMTDTDEPETYLPRRVP